MFGHSSSHEPSGEFCGICGNGGDATDKLFAEARLRIGGGTRRIERADSIEFSTKSIDSPKTMGV
jgi:hypothetical protein